MGMATEAMGPVRWGLACATLCAGVLYAANSMAPQPMSTAYHEGEPVAITIEPPAKGQRVLHFGPWQLGIYARGQRPRDRRLNFYIVVPGRQHHAEGLEDYDHNMIVSAIPDGDGPVEWDVYWVLVLDPHLKEELRSERDLLLTAQTRFLPGDLFEFDDIPADAVLREHLHVDSLEGLEHYRDKARTLPRILVLPTGSVVRMKVESPPAGSRD